MGENPARRVANYSRQFMGDFLQLSHKVEA